MRGHVPPPPAGGRSSPAPSWPSRRPPPSHARRAGRPRSCRSATRSSPARRAAGRATRSSARPTARAPTARGPGTGYDAEPRLRRHGRQRLPPLRRRRGLRARRSSRRRRKANLACSGAETKNIFRPSQRRRRRRTASPARPSKLRYVAQVDNVKVVVLSIGGNDLGFADIILACAQAYAARTGPCNPGQQQVVNAKRRRPSRAWPRRSDEVRAVMADAGYRAATGASSCRATARRCRGPPRRATPSSTRSAPRSAAAPSTTPTSTGPATRSSTRSPTACGSWPSRRAPSSWTCATRCRAARCARRRRGRRRSTEPPSGSTSEWARFLTLNLAQGEIQETLHPNFYAQQALGRCLTLAVNAGPGSGSCRPTAGQGPGRHGLYPR